MDQSELVRAEEASDSDEEKVIGRMASVSACYGNGGVVMGGERPIEPQCPPLLHEEMCIERYPYYYALRKDSRRQVSRVMVD